MNPIAGMGGSVALKGTDGPEVLQEAVARGAKKISPARAVEALSAIRTRKLDIEFLTASGEMGQDELHAAGLQSTVTTTVGSRTTREDTVRAVKTFVADRVELVLFVGGDGTARDVVEAAGASAVVLGIPAGVKMHSSVFALTPERSADAIEAYIANGRTRDAEVMDVDEAGVRDGVLRAKLFAVAKVPDDSSSIQPTKDAYQSASAEEEAEIIAKYVSETMEKGVAYILGPGSTTAAVAREIGMDKTILGVDVVKGGRLIKKDATEEDLYGIVAKSPSKVVVSPIGAQGFIFGRGNQQISPRVLSQLGKRDIIVIATPTKLRGTPVLRVDTGDPSLDSKLRGHMKVVVGYGRRRLVDVA